MKALKMRWEKWSPKAKKKKRSGGSSSGPGTRWGHTCNAIHDCLYLFGGYGQDNCHSNHIHVFNTQSQTWSKPSVKGMLPLPRDSHTCTTVGTSLYVFGGTDGKRPLKDLCVFNTETNTWSKPETQGEGPPAREGHGATLVGDRVYIFGGCGRTSDGVDDLYYNDLYALDTVNMTWSKAVVKVGSPPRPRESHTCSTWNNKLVVIGGEDASDSYMADVHMLDTDTMEWTEVKTSGDKLSPRASHATVSIGKFLLVFGGFTEVRRHRKLFDDLHVLDLETGVWTKGAAMEGGPTARFSCAGDFVNSRLAIVVFFGGCDEGLNALDDMYFLHSNIANEEVEKEHEEILKLSPPKTLKRKEPEISEVCNKEEKKRVAVSSEVKPRVPQIAAPSMPPLSTPPPLPTPLPFSTPKADMHPFYQFNPIEEKIFEAKVTDVFHYGYMLESRVDGRLLRGLVFSYKPGFTNAVHSYLTRKKSASDIDPGKTPASVNTKVKTPRTPRAAKTPRTVRQPRKRKEKAESTPRNATPAPSDSMSLGPHHELSVVSVAWPNGCNN